MPSSLGKLRRTLEHIPIIRLVARNLYHQFLLRKFVSSETYWIQLYANGGDAGVGSSSKFAQFKAKVTNHFVLDHRWKLLQHVPNCYLPASSSDKNPSVVSLTEFYIFEKTTEAP